MPGDVFHDHDGVIDDETAGDGKRHERQVIQREAAEIHDCAGTDERDRNGDRRHERGVNVAKEKEDDNDDEEDRDDKRTLDVVYRSADGQRAVKDGDEMLAARNRSLQRWDSGFDSIDGVDDVGARLAGDDEVDGGFTVDEACLADGLLRVDDVCNILKADRASIVIADDQRPVGFGLGDLIVGEDVGGAVAIGDLSLGGV